LTCPTIFGDQSSSNAASFSAKSTTVSGAATAPPPVASYLVPGDAVAVEQVTYPGIIDAVAHLVGVHKPRLAYLIPTFQNPTGRLLLDQGRRALLDLVHRHPHTTFVEDYMLGELDHGSPAPAPLAALAPDRTNLLTVGSLSKLVWGGRRVGWLRAPAPVVRRLAANKAVADLGSGAPGQVVAAHLLRAEHAQLRRWRNRQLAASLDALTEALARLLPDWRWRRPDGGQTLWVRLPGADARALHPDRPAPRRRRHPGAAAQPRPSWR
jgi:DNA-binding transcriptional MocR family regulator